MGLSLRCLHFFLFTKVSLLDLPFFLASGAVLPSLTTQMSMNVFLSPATIMDNVLMSSTDMTVYASQDILECSAKQVRRSFQLS